MLILGKREEYFIGSGLLNNLDSPGYPLPNVCHVVLFTVDDTIAWYTFMFEIQRFHVEAI